MKKTIIFIVLTTFFLTGCFASNSAYVLGSNQTQLEMRNYQSRKFDTNDKKMVMRAVVATMQDLGFIINQADYNIGTVSGSSFSNLSTLTVTVRDMNSKQLIVRVIAQHNRKLIQEPKAYNNFFESLSKSLFLEAHEIE